MTTITYYDADGNVIERETVADGHNPREVAIERQRSITYATAEITDDVRDTVKYTDER